MSYDDEDDDFVVPPATIEWDDASTLHRAEGGSGILHGFKAIRSGTLIELLQFVMTLPEAERRDYAIEKSGDHRIDYTEMCELMAREDYPG